MFGIEFPGLVRVAIQITLAVVGASSLWGSVFAYRHRKTLMVLQDPGRYSMTLIFRVFAVSLCLFLLSWTFGYWYFGELALAHEGIKLPVTDSYLIDGFKVNSWFVPLLAILGLTTVSLYAKARDKFYKYAAWLFGGQLILATIIVGNVVWTGSFDKEFLFHIMHNWHSFLTLGSVILVDVLFLFTWHQNKSVRRTIYNFFPWISAGIWIGLGMDFASVWLIIDQAWNVTHQFLFSQTVVAVLVINGALLSTKVNDWLLDQVENPNAKPATPLWQLALGLSGAISIVSWTTITFVDFFELQATYPQMIAAWITVIVCAFIGHTITDKLMDKMYAKPESMSLDLADTVEP